MTSVKTPSARRSFVLALVLAGVLLFLAIRGVAWEELIVTVAAARVELLALGLATGLTSLFLRGMRWWTLLRGGGQVSLASVFWATMLGYLANSYLPARGGDLIRCVLVGGATGVSRGFALATTLSERLLDVAALALVGAVMLTTMGGLPAWLEGAAPVTGTLAALGIVGLVVVCRFQRVVLDKLASLWGLGRWRGRLLRIAEESFLGLGSFQRPGRAAVFTLLTSAIWLLDGVGSIVVAQALGLGLTLPQALVLLAALGLGSALPSTPGFVGIYQFVAVTVLVPFGYSQSEALAYILVSQALYYLLVTVLGGVGLWRLSPARKVVTEVVIRPAGPDVVEP